MFMYEAQDYDCNKEKFRYFPKKFFSILNQNVCSTRSFLHKSIPLSWPFSREAIS